MMCDVGKIKGTWCPTPPSCSPTRDSSRESSRSSPTRTNTGKQNTSNRNIMKISSKIPIYPLKPFSTTAGRNSSRPRKSHSLNLPSSSPWAWTSSSVPSWPTSPTSTSIKGNNSTPKNWWTSVRKSLAHTATTFMDSSAEWSMRKLQSDPIWGKWRNCSGGDSKSTKRKRNWICKKGSLSLYNSHIDFYFNDNWPI